MIRVRAASLPPTGLPGLHPSWSRLVQVRDAAGIPRTFHVLDSWAGRTDGGTPVGTVLCVHGNPTWSYLWRRLLAAPPPGWRVIAPDHLGMGYSERIDRPRVLSERVDDLGALTDALGIDGPVVIVAHDWGGIISLGWARRHRAQLRGVVLTNTAVHQPQSSAGPLLIRLAHVRLINQLSCLRTPLFVRVTTSLTWPRLPRGVRDAFAAPYRTAADRAAISDFVTDIPFAAGHPSRPVLDVIADDVASLDVPALLLWGPRDPVFLEEHLRDLQQRLPQAAVHRYEQASHLLPEDAPSYAQAVVAWVGQLGAGPSGVAQPGSTPAIDPSTAVEAAELPTVLAALHARAADDSLAVVEVGGAGISWADLHSRVNDIAAGMRIAGIRPGDRVALLIPPSIDLTVALYAVWRAGAVIVVADKGLGLRGLGRALRSARIDHLIADTAGLLAAGPLRIPGTRIAVRDVPLARFVQVKHTLAALALAGAGHDCGPEAGPDDEAAVLFTSGATGPAKGVLYRHRQVRAQLALIRATYSLTAADRIVAAFAPFALYGPALGIPSAVPDTDVTKPATLTAAALGDAAAILDATVVFASPAALRNVLATAAQASAGQLAALAGLRLLMSAGAPVPAPLLRRLAEVLPAAQMHTPYGMTEVLPVTDITLAQIEHAGAGDGVCVGRPLPGVQVRVAPLDRMGAPTDGWAAAPGVSGEIWVRAAHVKDRYDALWAIDQAAAAHPGWHRTGDVGQLDEQGRLWIQGRTVHVISTSAGPVTPVAIENRVQDALGITAGVAVVGVGPSGIQQIIVVVAADGGPLAPLSLTNSVRAAAGHPVASVLITSKLPVDIRHNSKIDRVAVGHWAAELLAGG